MMTVLIVSIILMTRMMTLMMTRGLVALKTIIRGTAIICHRAAYQADLTNQFQFKETTEVLRPFPFRKYKYSIWIRWRRRYMISISYIFWWCQDFLHIGANDNFGFTQVGQPAPYGPVQLPLHSTELKNIIIKTTMTTGWINKFESHVERLNWLTNRALSSSMVLPLWYLKRITKSGFRAPTT